MNRKYKIFIGGLIIMGIMEEIFHTQIFNETINLNIDVKWIYALIIVIILLNIKSIIRLFQYHGAEHKVINTYIQYGYVDKYLVKKASRFNKRCGSNIALIQIIFYTILWIFDIDSILIHLLTIIISFQIIKKLILVDSKWDKYINILQWITVLEPNDEQINLATEAFYKMQQAHRIYVKETAN